MHQLPHRNDFLNMDEEEISYQCLTNEQLIDKTAGLLRVLEQRLEWKLSLCIQAVQNLMSEREMLKTVNSIIDQLQSLTSSGSAQGFVFGLITKNKIWSASSNNLSRWWNRKVNFERNGPRILASETCEPLGLDALKDLPDPTLSSIISALMPHCLPAQRSAPFHGKTPVAWWPKGTEEWWGRVNILKDSGPPEYKKPHDLKKNAKIAVLIAIIKNLEPNFSKIRSLVSDSETLKSKMKQREKYIWLAVLRGEEIRKYGYQRCSSANVLGNSGVESNSHYIAGKNVEVEKVDDGGIGDKLVNMINSPLCEHGKSENKKKIFAGKQAIDTESSTSTRSGDLVSKATNVDEPSKVNDRENSVEEFIAHPEQVQVNQKNSPVCSQMFTKKGLLLEKDTASKSENTKKQKLMGIVNPDPKRLRLPYWNHALSWRSHDISGDYAGTMNDPPQKYQLQTNNVATNSSKNRTNQSYDSSTSLPDLAFIQGQVNTSSSNSLVLHDQSRDNEYTIKNGDYAGTMNNPPQKYLLQTNDVATNQSYDSSTSLLDLALIRGQVNTSNSNSLVPHDQSRNHQYTIKNGGQYTTEVNYPISANQSSTNLNPELQHQLLLNSAKDGSVYVNPQSQDQLNSFSMKQDSRDSRAQLQNQFGSRSISYPILDSSHSQINGNERIPKSSISTEQGMNYDEDVDGGKNNDVGKNMVVENAMDGDGDGDATADESGLQNFEFDGLADDLNAFFGLDSFDSNILDGSF